MCWLLRAHTVERVGLLYAIALALAVGLVAWTGYRGGQLSLGEDHLTEHMPEGLRRVLGLPNAGLSASTDANTFYGARVQPIFTSRCITCHGPSKHRANLRLDSYGSLMRGGKDGPVVRAGNVQGSDLFRRITLPPGHDDFMPKEATRPLSVDQVKLIELWIGAGASDTLPVAAIKDAPGGSASPAVAEVTFEAIDADAVTRMRAGITPAVAQLQKQFPNILDYESRGSANLFLNASILGAKFGDSDFAAFAPVAEHITVADFSRTAITDRSVIAIAAMKHLRVLRLMNAGITDATLEGLGALDRTRIVECFRHAGYACGFADSRETPQVGAFLCRANCDSGELSPEGTGWQSYILSSRSEGSPIQIFGKHLSELRRDRVLGRVWLAVQRSRCRQL